MRASIKLSKSSFKIKISQAYKQQKITKYLPSSKETPLTLPTSKSFLTPIRLTHHQRGRQIVCQLIDIVLRPQLLICPGEGQHNQSQISKRETKSYLQNDQSTIIIYNAIQILTNQYEEFVQYVFNEQNTQSNIQSQEKQDSQGHEFTQKSGETQKLSPPIILLNNKSQEMQVDIQKNVGSKKVKTPSLEEENWEDDCVIMDSNFPELTKNDEDSVLKKIVDITKLNATECFKCTILDQMFLLFEQPAPIEETPVSYFNKIILQFVYQKPQEIMRYFYCDKEDKEWRSEEKQKKIEGKSQQQNSGKQESKQKLIKSSIKESSLNCPKIRKIAQHLYNNSVIELLVHVLQLQYEGNFFIQQKTEIMKAIAEEVFHYEIRQKKQGNNKGFNSQEQVSTVSDMTESKIDNYVLFLKSLYEKLQDRYEQQKFTPILKSHLNDEQLIQKIMNYFLFHFNYFDMSGLLNVLIQILQMDEVNFKIHKSLTHNNNPFGAGNYSFHQKNEESSMNAYDLKLSKQILDKIQNVISKLTVKYRQWQGNTMRMIQYYELIHSWLNVVIKQRQNYIKNQLITPQFINECVYKIKTRPNSTILHNSIKNIFVDFLPKINESIKIVLSPQCSLLSFIQNQLEPHQRKEKKIKRKCYENQLYHIGKGILSAWEQQKMLNMIHKTQDDQIQQDKESLSQPTSPTSDGQNIIRLQNLKRIVAKKQQLYEHLICGDPRKMGQYQQEQSSEIIMASSFKNFFKPSFNANPTQETSQSAFKSSGGRYGQQKQGSIRNEKEEKKDDLRKQTVSKINKIKNLKIGDQFSGPSIFESVISPLNANRSHTFNFDIDALPLDSDGSEEAVSEQDDLPIRETHAEQMSNQQQMKLMEQNIQNLQILGSDILNLDSNILSSNHSNSQDKNILAVDNHRKEELCNSIDFEGGQIQRIDSYLQVYSPRKQSEEDLLSLGLDSKSGSKLSEENKGSKLQNASSSLMKQELLIKQQVSQQEEFLLKSDNSSTPPVVQEKKKKNEEENDNQLGAQFVKHYSSYLQYDLDAIFKQVQNN